MVHVQDHHFGRAPRLAARFDHARERIESLHERQRTGSPPAARENGIFLAQRRQVRPRPRAPLEQHAFGLRQIQNGLQRIAHRDDEARRALRPRHALFQLGDAVLAAIVDPAVAAPFLHAHVEPHRRVETRLLRQHQVRQVVAERFPVHLRLEIPVLLAPLGDGIHHPLHQLGGAGLPLRRPEFAVEVLAGDDVGGRLRPVHRNFHVALLEDHRTLVVSDQSRAGFPLHIVVGCLARFQPGGKIAREGYSRPVLRLRIGVLWFHLRTHTNCILCHCKSLRGSRSKRATP